MVVVFDKDIFIRYLESLEPIGRKPEIFTLIKIFQNENNKIAITDELIQRIENQINSSPAMLNIFQQFLKDIIDNKRYIPCESHPDEIQDLIQTYNSIVIDDDKFILVDKQNNQLINYDDYFHCTCQFPNIRKTNKCWLIFNLLSGDPVTVRYSDFTNDRQIQLFFKSIFDFVKNTDEVYILDSYCNLHRHLLFEPLKTRGASIIAFTSSAFKSQFDVSRLNSEIKEHFGRRRTTVKFSSDRKLIHERTLKFRNVIVESNHDFAEIKRANQNWKLDVTICSNLRAQIEDKCRAYNTLS